MDSYVGNGVVVHQAKHCRVHDNESYRVVTKRVPEVPSEGRRCSLQSRPLETMVIPATWLTLRAPGRLICS